MIEVWIDFGSCELLEECVSAEILIEIWIDFGSCELLEECVSTEIFIRGRRQ